MSITVGNIKEAHPAIYKRLLELTNIKYENIDDTYWILSLFPNTQAGSTEGEQFWREIDNGNFQVFYDRYPEYAKVQKDWSKATDDELIAEAKRRYQEGTEIKDANDPLDRGVVTGGFSMKGSDVYAETDRGIQYVFCKYHDCVKWAEIVSQPETPVADARSHSVLFNPLSPEPKAGDMVEGFNGSTWRPETRFTGGRLSNGDFICEDLNPQDRSIRDAIKFFNQIRLPQKSEVSKMVDSFLNEIYIDDAELNDLVRNAVENGIKWGQQNSDKK